MKYMAKIGILFRNKLGIRKLMKRLTVVVISILIGTMTLQAQDNLHFSVDRPGISDYPTIIPKGNLQIEAGLEYYQREDHRSIFLPTILLRTAITKGVEVRFTNRLVRVDSAVDNPDDKLYYFGALDVKALLIRERGWIPAISALVGYSITPETTRKLKGPIWGNYALLLLENNLQDKVLFNYNFGITWNGYSSSVSTMYSFCFEIELSPRAAVFIEQSTFFHEVEKNDNWINAGYTHLIARHSQIDFSAGTNMNRGEQDFFVALGYSTRLRFNKEK